MKHSSLFALAATAFFPIIALAQAPEVPPSPSAKPSFEAYAAKFSRSGNAALHLLQTYLNCPDSPVARTIDSAQVSTVVLYETMGAFRPSESESDTLTPKDFRQRVLSGIAQIQDVDETDVASSVDCALPQSQVVLWASQLETESEGYKRFKRRMGTFAQ